MTEPILLRNFTTNARRQSSGLSTALAQARLILRVNQQLAQQLPKPFAKNLKLVRVINNTAVLGTNSPAIAFKAKQQKALLLNHLTHLASFAHIKSVVVKVL